MARCKQLRELDFLIVTFAAWYWLKHNWAFGHGLAICVPAGVAFVLIWTTLERRMWNHELRRNGLSKEGEVWSVTEFPQL